MVKVAAYHALGFEFESLDPMMSFFYLKFKFHVINYHIILLLHFLDAYNFFCQLALTIKYLNDC